MPIDPDVQVLLEAMQFKIDALSAGGSGGTNGDGQDIADAIQVAIDAAVSNNISEVFSVKDYGATGDGTDETSAFQSAIDAAEVDGGLVVVSPATYRAAGLIVNSSNVVIVGLGGPNACVIKAPFEATESILKFVGEPGAGHVRSNGLNNIRLHGNGRSIRGLDLQFVSHFKAFNFKVSNCKDDALYFEEVWDSSFYDLQGLSNGAPGKFALHVFNGASDNSNNLRFYSINLESNVGGDIHIDTSGAGGDNNNIGFYAAHIEIGDGSGTLAVKTSGKANISHLYFENCFVQGYEGGVAFDLQKGDCEINNCLLTNNSSGGTGVLINGANWTGITNTRFVNWTTDINYKGTARDKVHIGPGNQDSSGASRNLTIVDYNNNTVEMNGLDNDVFEFSVADDAVQLWAPKFQEGFLEVTIADNINFGGIARYECDNTESNIAAVYAGADFNVTTGVLTGATGTDAKVTLSAHTDGNLYFENRSGGSLSFSVKVTSGRVV